MDYTEERTYPLRNPWFALLLLLLKLVERTATSDESVPVLTEHPNRWGERKTELDALWEAEKPSF